MSKTNTKYNHDHYIENRDIIIADRKKYRKENPVAMKRQALKKSYGITYEDWQLIWESQDGKCAICGKSFIKPSDAYVDHDHKTNKIRGLLCNRCNLGIGYFNDDIEVFMNVIKYLDI